MRVWIKEIKNGSKINDSEKQEEGKKIYSDKLQTLLGIIKYIRWFHDKYTALKDRLSLTELRATCAIGADGTPTRQSRGLIPIVDSSQKERSK